MISNNIVALLLDRFTLIAHWVTAGKFLKKSGLSFTLVEGAQRTYDTYRSKALRDFLISVDKLERKIIAGKNDVIEVFTDESYVNINHAMKNSFIHTDESKGSDLKKKTGKRRRLIIVHTITQDGPLCELDDATGYPVDDLIWKGDTPQSEPHPDVKLNEETLWIAQSHTGDYHDNVNSTMFMKWVTDKLRPVFARKYPGKKMLLIADNAPYHHSREIGSLGSLSKKAMVIMMTDHEVEYIDLPLVSDLCSELSKLDGHDDHPDVQDRGDCVQVNFNPDEQSGRVAASRPCVANIEELKASFVTYLKEHKPEIVQCKVYSYLHSLGHSILCTPPYCPELQPIELFWAAGKITQ